MVYSSQSGAEAEKEAIRKVTTAINNLHDNARGGNRAVQSWRLRFYNWKRQIEIGKRYSITEDDGIQLQNAIIQLNQSTEELNRETSSVDLYSYPDEYDDFKNSVMNAEQAVQKAYRRVQQLNGAEHYETNLATLVRQFDQLREQLQTYNRAMIQYDDNFEMYSNYDSNFQDARQKLANNVQGLNQRAGIKLMTLEPSELEPQPIKLNTNEVDRYALEQTNQLRAREEQNADDVLDMKVFDTVGYQPDYGMIEDLRDDYDYTQIQVLLEQEIENHAKELIDGLYPPLWQQTYDDYFSVEEPIEPEYPIFVMVSQIALININEYIQTVDEELVEELDGYAHGAYAYSLANQATINDLVERIGNQCPNLEYVKQAFDPSELHQALNELKATYGLFIKGGEGNSSRGQVVISNLKTATSALYAVQTVDDLKRLEGAFNQASTAMLDWFFSAWFQFGGKPTNSNTNKKWRGAGGLKSAKPKR